MRLYVTLIELRILLLLLSPGAISYRCFIVHVPESVSQAIFEIIGHKHIGITTLTFLGKVTWRYRSRDQLIRRMSFLVDDTSVTRLYLHFKLFASKYIWVTILILQGHIMSPVTRPFDTPGAISYRWSTVTKSVSPAIFEINGPKDIGGHDLDIRPLNRIFGKIRLAEQKFWLISGLAEFLMWLNYGWHLRLEIRLKCIRVLC